MRDGVAGRFDWIGVGPETKIRATLGMEETEKGLGKHKAILLIGPTGSGKTPVGDLLEARGLWGRRCVHFDFGRELRRVARHGDLLFEREEVAFIHHVLDEGALLEEEHFHIAREILSAFIAQREVGREDVVVLNGLPRHVGQAADLGWIVGIETVVYLNCATEVALERLRTNAGGDRDGRVDDDLDAAKKKFALFEGRTKPLLDHYRALGANVVEVTVDPDSTPEEIRHDLGEQLT